jgi:hypothetical protein
VQVAQGTWAARLNIPVGCTVTHVGGVELKGSAQKQLALMRSYVNVRPLRIAVRVPPPVDTPRAKGPRRSFSFQLGTQLLSSRSRSSSSKPPRPDATPTATPSDTHRSDICSPPSTPRAALDASADRMEVRQIL